jgi:hypothetical protein
MELKDSSLKKDRDAALRAQLTEGLRDPELRREALRYLREREGSFFELRDWACEWSKQGENTKVSVREAQATMDQNESTTIVEMLREQNKLLKEQIEGQKELQTALRSVTDQKPRWKNNGQCFNCKSSSHQIRDCPLPIKDSLKRKEKPVNLNA